MNNLYARSMTFTTAAQLFDVDGIKTSIATALTAQTYTTFNGTNTVGGSFARLASYPTVLAAVAAGAYTASSTVVFTGTYGGAVVTRTATIVGTDGNATAFIADGPLDIGSITSIVVAAQADTDGFLSFGWTGLAPRKDKAWTCVAREAGTLYVAYPGGETDDVPLPIHGEHYAYVSRILAATTIDFTVYE